MNDARFHYATSPLLHQKYWTVTNTLVDIPGCITISHRHLRPKDNVYLHVLTKHTVRFRLGSVMWSSDPVIMPGINKKNHWLISIYGNFSTFSSLKATESSMWICSGFSHLISPMLYERYNFTFAIRQYHYFYVNDSNQHTSIHPAHRISGAVRVALWGWGSATSSQEATWSPFLTIY